MPYQVHRSLLAALLGLAAGAAQAQSASPATSKPSRPAKVVIAKIHVRSWLGSYAATESSIATKTETPLIETPAAVQVVTQQALQDQQVTNIGQVAQDVSGVFTRLGGANDNGQPWSALVIRGFGSDTMFQDGVRFDSFGSDSNLYDQPLADVESVDVLKGPAAILYGAVEPGGILNVVTKQPQDVPSYAISQQIGSYGLYRTEINATGPLNPSGTLLYRLDSSWENQGSITNDVSSNDFFIAPVLEWRPDGATDVKLEYNYHRADIGQEYGTMAFLDTKPLFNDIALNYADAHSPDIETTNFVALSWSHMFDDGTKLSQKFAVQVVDANGRGLVPDQLLTDADASAASGATVTSPSGYVVGTVTNNDVNNVQNFDLTTEARKSVSTGPVNHELLAGVELASYTTRGHIFQKGQADGDIQWADLFEPSYIALPFTAAATPFVYDWQNTQQASAYVQDNAALPWNLHLLLNLRYDYIHQTGYSILVPYALSFTPNTLYGHAFTPRAALLWHPLDWLSPYLSYSQGYGPSKNGYVEPDNGQMPPSSGQQYEAGVKTAFFDGRLAATADVFQLTKTNVPTADPVDQAFELAIGKERTRGVEVDVDGEVRPGWDNMLDYSYTDARVLDASPLTDIAPGSRLNGLPYNAFNWFTTYALQSGRLKGLKFGGGVDMADQAPYEAIGASTNQLIPGYAEFNLMTSYSFRLDGLSLCAQLNADNIFNKRYLTEAQALGLAADPPYTLMSGFWGEPRTVVGELSAKF